MRTLFMKKLAFCAAVLFLSVGAQAQGGGFDELAGIKGVEYIHLDKEKLAQLAENGESIQYGDTVVLGDKKGEIFSLLETVDVYVCEEGDGADKLEKKVKPVLNQKDYQTIVDMSQDDQKVKILQKKTGENVRNVIFVVDKEDKQVVLVVLEGKLDLAKLIEEQSNKND